MTDGLTGALAACGARDRVERRRNEGGVDKWQYLAVLACAC
jgi:hypothetical protein